MPSRTETVTAAEIIAARPEAEKVARRTPVLSSRTISERAGGTVALKAENLQRTGSFKVRGASAKLAVLGAEGASGVVAASAGNHAQGLAAAAAARGLRCEVFVPADAPIAKAEAAASGAPREPEITPLDQYPLNVNDQVASDKVRDAFRRHFPADRVQHAGPAPASEDFGCFGTGWGVPSVY